MVRKEKNVKQVNCMFSALLQKAQFKHVGRGIVKLGVALPNDAGDYEPWPPDG